MKIIAGIALTATSLLLANTVTVQADTYFPYQSYDDYYKTHSVEPPPGQTPSQPPPAAEVKPPPRPEQPITLTQPPEFLFPPALGFGVAVGVPYDMFYVSKAFYFLKTGSWYRSSSYKGPWTLIGLSQVPTELRKQKLSKIRELRNREFAKFYKNKGRYQGKYFRPDEVAAPPKTGR